MWALEGSGSYGAGLARFLTRHGEQVLEVERPRREGRRGRLKSDALDAERAARQVLAGAAGARPRLGSETQALRALLVAREGAVVARTAARNELRALIVGAPPELRERLEALPPKDRLRTCARFRLGGDSERAALALALRSLARRILALRTEAEELEAELARRVTCSRRSSSPAAASAPSRRRRSSSPGRSRGGCAARLPSPAWLG